MKYKIAKGFQNDFHKLKNKKLAQAILATLDDVSSAESIKNISNTKKLKSHDNAYRIRIGDYRIGIFLEKEIIIFAAFAHRKDIYKQFP